MATSNSRPLTLKLLVDKKRQKVLFADATKDFVDFLFTLLSLLSLPAGTIIRLLSKDAMVASLGKLRKTIYICSNNNYYRNYESLHTFGSEDPKVKCPECDCSLSIPTTVFSFTYCSETPAYSGAGKVRYVKGLVTYMILDDLEVKPMSTSSCIALLNRFGVRDVGVLEEKVIDLGLDEGIKLLKTSLQSKFSLMSSLVGILRPNEHLNFAPHQVLELVAF